MADVKVQRDTKVIISLDEFEAGKLLHLLLNEIDFEMEPWALEVHTAMEAAGVYERTYTGTRG